MTIPPDQEILRKQINEAALRGPYVLRNLHIANATLGALPKSLSGGSISELVSATIKVNRGKVDILDLSGGASGISTTEGIPEIDAAGRIGLPGFVDCHTHLDKGHILPRTPGADGSFPSALTTTQEDRVANWNAADLTRRMEFGLRCAYHHGTVALRSHLDSIPPQDGITWPVFRELRQEWRGRIEMQGACLVPIVFARDEAALATLAARVAEFGGVLGAVAFPVPDIDTLLDRMFAAATQYGLDLDFHADESADPSADALLRIAKASLRARYPGKVLVGHCCSLAMQNPAAVDCTLDTVARAGLSVVSLPMCNLYLQDRRHDGTTPRWRGVTLVHEMKKRGIPVSLGSDNTRDPFFAYGDLDMMETWRMGTRIAQLDHGIDGWPRAVGATPAAAMGLCTAGVIAEGHPADLILCEGRGWSEVLSRPESGRIVLRDGIPLFTSLPSYRDLDSLTGLSPN